jgi:hypothetical protein
MGIPTLVMIALHWSMEARRTKVAEETKAAEEPPAKPAIEANETPVSERP